MAMSLVLLVMLVALTVTQFSGALVHRQLQNQGQALNVAHAGLVEGLDWFRRQTTQPVTQYTSPRGPVNENALNPCTHIPVHNPPLNDTDLQSNLPCARAIERDMEISEQGRLWGHYEVVAGNPSAVAPASPCKNGTGVVDLSLSRGKAGAGQIWQLGSQGVIYVRNDTSRDGNGMLRVAYNQAPNRILSKRTVRSEIGRLAFNPPSVTGPPSSSVNAALYLPTGTNATLTGKARIAGTGGVGVASQASAPAAPAAPSAITGSPATQTGLQASSFTIQNIFGVSQAELFAMADIYVSTPADLPNNTPPFYQLPGMQLIVINAGAGNPVVFNGTSPNRLLRGSGILVVIGNLTIGGASSWNGVIYVNGNYTQTDPASVSGSVILQGTNSATFNNATASISGSADFADLIFDNFIITQVKQQLVGYRFVRPPYVPCPSPTTGECAP